MVAVAHVQPKTHKTFGEILAETRAKAGDSVKHIAEKVRVQQHDVRNWEAGLCYPARKDFQRLTAVYGQLKAHRDLLPADIGYGRNAGHEDALDAEIAALLSGKFEEIDPDELAAKERKEVESKPRPWGLSLREARELNSLEVDDLAELLSVSHSAVRAWEMGVSMPTRQNYNALLDLFPGLKLVAEPKIRDIAPPVGRGGKKAESTTNVIALKPPTVAAPVIEPVPASSPRPVAPKSGVRDVLRCATVLARSSVDMENVRTLLRAAKELNYSLSDLEELLSEM